jgi:hypothetical protein
MTSDMEGGPARHRPPEDPATAKRQARGDSKTVQGQRNDGGWCRCAECGRTFGGLSGFDLHSIAEHPGGTAYSGRCGCSNWWPRCATDAELEQRGLHLSAKGWWTRSDGPWGQRLSTQTAVEAA